VDAAPSFVTGGGDTVTLAELRPRRTTGASFRPVEHPTLGRGTEARASFGGASAVGIFEVTITMYDRDSAVILGITSDATPLRSVDYFGKAGGNTLLGDDVRYFSDRSHFYVGSVLSDGYARRAALEATKPALVWSEASQQGLLLTLYDYVASPAWLTLQRDPGGESVRLIAELVASLDHDFGAQRNAPPALTVELFEGPVSGATFDRFRGLTRTRYPDAPWPTGLKYQWGTWYVIGPGINADFVQRQIERLASRFADLGGWQVVIDAGWHLQYGHPDAELGVLDREKFPQGVRALADLAHARGMDVILYLGTGFVHDSPGNGGEWLALRGLIDRYPQWMIPFQHEASEVNRYLLDYRNPEAEAYVRSVIRDFFNVHGVDGILLDGLADAEGQLIPRDERDHPDGPPYPLLPTLDIYRMIWEEAVRHHPRPFVESSWLNPMAANPYTTIFRYGDEIDRVDSPYPFSGFLQRLDYAIFARQALGQRTYVGTATGDPSRPEFRWWAQAAVALGAAATSSFDLNALTPERAAHIRADLIAMDPFKGTTSFGPGLFPDTFATTREGVTYLGVLNRQPIARDVAVGLGQLGLTASAYAAFDVQGDATRRIDGDFTVAMPPRSFRLFVLRPTDGVLWTSSVLSAERPADGSLALNASGPADVPGFVHAASTPPSAVLLDGRPLQATSGAPQEGQYRHDETAGVTSIRYSHASARRIEIRR
jgi:hypothetical protein